MATRKQLFSIDFHSVDEDGSSAYRDGEVEWHITKELRSYIEKYGWEGVRNIMGELASVTYEIMHILKMTPNQSEEKSEKTISKI